MKRILTGLLLIALSLFAFTLTGCGKTFSDIKISASYQNQDDGYLSLTVGQEATVVFTVTDLPSNATSKLTFSKDSNIISNPQIVSFDKSKGTNTIKITALSAGNATLRAIADGGNFYELQVKATLAITDFYVKDNAILFAVRGENNPKKLVLDSTIFNFYPADTSQKEIIFKDSNDNILTEIDANEYEGDQIAIFASSPYLSKQIEIKISLIDEIGIVNTYDHTEAEDAILTSSEQADTDNEKDDILFITNRSNYSRKVLRVVVAENTSSILRVNRRIISQDLLQCSDFDILKTYQENDNTIFEFELQSLQEGHTTIQFQVYYLGYESYTINRTFDVLIKNAPDQLRLNDIIEEENPTQTLFDGAYSTVYSTHYLSIIPSTAIYDNIEIEYNLSELTEDPNAVMSDYILFTVGGLPIEQTLTNLSNPIVAKGVKPTGGKTISLVIKVTWGDEYGIVHGEGSLYYKLNFEVKTGADSLRLSQEFQASEGIYVQNDGVMHTFYGLYVSKIEAYTENLTVIPFTQGAALYASVEPNPIQPAGEQKIIPINITPKSVGLGIWRVILPNGVYYDLTIHVVTSLQSIRMDFDEYNSSPTSTRNYDLNNSLSQIGVKLGKDGSVYTASLQLTFTTNPINYNFTNEKLYVFTKETTNPVSSTVVFNQNTNILSISTTINGFSATVFEYSLEIKAVKEFKLVGLDDFEIDTPEYDEFIQNNIFEGNLIVDAYVPLSSVAFSQREISLYSYSHLGINYKEFATEVVDLVYSPNELSPLFEDLILGTQSQNIKVDLTSSISYSKNDSLIEITGYGSYDFESGVFLLDVTSTVYEPFYIYANVLYYGELFTCSLKIVPLFYQSVTGVRLSNYLPVDTVTNYPTMYLDPTHSYQDVFTYVLPENAVHKDLRYTFEPNTGYSSMIVRLENSSNSGVRVVYNNEYLGISEGGEGFLVIAPTANIMDVSATPSNALKIHVKVGAGSLENPFLISTAQELLNIGTSGYDKHYVIENIIDLSNINFSSLGTFTGSIDGKGVGKIIGLNINKLKIDQVNNYGYAGLFEKIHPQIVENVAVENTGIIKNLIISGGVNLPVNMSCSVGLVAGELGIGACLENVTVILSQSTVTINTTNELNIGGVVGVNLGVIENHIGVNLDTFVRYVNYPIIVMNGRFSCIYTLQEDQTRSYFGGVAGANEGVIQRLTASNVKLYNDDNYVASVNMYITGATSVSNTSEKLAFSVGAVAGKNSAIIGAERHDGDNLDNLTYYDYLKVAGIIEIFQANNRLGGLVGENLGAQANIINCVSRVKIKSKGNGGTSAYVGGLFAYNDSGIIKDCAIQALEDGVSLGASISLIYSAVFGLTQDQIPVLNGKVNVYGYDSNALSIHTDDNSFVIDNNLKSFTYVGDIEEGGIFPQGKRHFETDTTTFATLSNYYGDYLVGNIGKMFTPVSAELVIDPNNTMNALTSETTNVNMAYLYYYQATNSQNQEYIDNLNVYELPFDFSGEINLYSFDSNIISIGSDGRLTANSTGLVKIRILSSLNAKISQDVYLYVVHCTDSFVLYMQSINDENIINAGKVIKIYSGQTLPLLAVFSHSNVVVGGYEIAVNSGEEFTITNQQTYEEGFVKSAQIVQIGSMFGFQAINGKGNTTFAIYGLLQFTNNGHEFTSSNLTHLGGPIGYTFTVEHAIGATNINANIDTISIEPSDKFDFNVLVQTDDFDEQLVLTETRLVGTDIVSGNYFDKDETNRVYTIEMSNSFPQEYLSNVQNGALTLIVSQHNKTDDVITQKNIDLDFDIANLQIKLHSVEDYASTLSLDMQQLFQIIFGKEYDYTFELILEQVEGLDYNLSDGLIVGTTLSSYIVLSTVQYYYSSSFVAYDDLSYAGTYYINASPESTQVGSQSLFSTITVNIGIQTILGVTIDSFAGSTANDIDSGKEQCNFIDPQSSNSNHFRISLLPVYADYDYVEVVNQTSGVTILITLIDTNGNNKFGALLIDDGIRIAKDKVTPTLYVRYAASSVGVVNGQVITFAVIAYKNQTEIFKTIKYITVKFTKDVTFDIENKDETQEFIYLTRGMSYNFSITSNGYLENEIIMESTRTDIITIDKANRKISVTSNSIVYSTNNLIATIQIYGNKIVSGEVISSSPYYVDVVIVDYFVIPNSEHTIIKNGSNGIVSLGLGNTYTFSAEFISGLTIEYNTSITTISQSISTFENSLSTLGTWYYQIGVLNQDGSYSYSNAWNTISNSVSSNNTNGYFTITKTSAGYVFTPLKITSITSPAYKFRFDYGYDYRNGLAIYSATQNLKQQEFLFNIFQISSMDTPTPIYTFEELQNMNEGVYYILMNDITLSAAFSPITSAIAGLDGNSHKLIINSNISVENIQKVGIFGTIAHGSLIRNLTVQITVAARLTINQITASTIYVGILAGENNGMISNVMIETVFGASYRVIFSGEQTSTINYVGGLVGINNGYITNSRAILNLTASASLGGFVGYNVGKISSSYVDNSLLINTSTEAQNKTAGFAVYNSALSSTGGIMTSCYVTGLHSGTIALPIYANNTSKILRSSTETAGFVYENNGDINNSYSDIPIQTSSKSSGFVFVNKGKIYNTYSTCQMKSNSQESYGFVYDNSTGSLQNNYYLSDVDINYSINTSNASMNQSMLKVLKKVDFAETTNFESFIFTDSSVLTKGVWFMPSQSYQSQFNNQSKTFIVNRPEIVSANLVTISTLAVDLDRTSQDQITGAITYYYINVGTYSQGSMYNPYLIINAAELENRILSSNSANLNTNYYRLVSDIDYEDDEINSSSLYNTVLIGDLEGNGFEIRGYVIDSAVSTSSAGFFAKIGNGSSQQGTVKNLTLKPKYINMPNSIVVGSLAGTLDAGTIFNIIVDGFEYSNNGVVVLGKNVVGGVIGRAIKNFSMFNIQSSISTNATYRSPSTLDQKATSSSDMVSSYFLFRSHLISTLGKLSYAGTVAGVLAGTGSISYVQTNGIIASMAEFASLAFGGVGDGVVASNILVTVVQGSFIQPAAYGGLVAGEFYGKMNNAKVTSANIVLNLFKTIPFTPYAIGGLVGLMGCSDNLNMGKEGSLGGKIENSSVNLSISLNDVEIVGGLVGELIGALPEITSISNSNFTGTIQSLDTTDDSVHSSNIVGGIIGKVTSKPSAPILISGSTFALGFMTQTMYLLTENLTVTGGSLSVKNDSVGEASIGGIVGMISIQASSTASLQILSSHSSNEVVITSDIYGALFDIYAGGIVGKVTKTEFNSVVVNSSILNIASCTFSGRIALILRDLGYNSSNAIEPDSKVYIIHYGKIAANEDDKILDESTKQFAVVGEDNFYENNDMPVTSGSVGANKKDYLLLQYIKNGTMTIFDENTDPVTLFNRFVVGDETVYD